jgi:hypothetical protein
MKAFKVEPGDPYDLDRDEDGYACEHQFLSLFPTFANCH